MTQAVSRALFDEVMVPNYAPAAFIPVRGAGSHVWDQEGREYLDFGGGIAVLGLGHGHPTLVQALTEQAQGLWHVSNAYTNEPALRLAKKLVDATFAERVFFCNSGAEANEACFKLARKYAADHVGAHKNEIISTYNSFHGRTLFTVAVGGQAKYLDGFLPAPAGIRHVEYNDIEALKTAVSERTCAIVVEPIQGEGGVQPATRAYLQAARALADQYGALLIFDEVQTGVGRSGELYAYMDYDVVPDLLSTAKGLGCGFPVGAMLTTSKIAKSFNVGTHGSTYGGNLLATHVAECVLDIINTPELLAGVRAKSQRFIDGLHKLNEHYPVFKEIRGVGLLLGCELKDDYVGHAKDITRIATEQGLLLLIAGPNVVRLAPALNIPDADIDAGLATFGRVLEKFLSN